MARRRPARAGTGAARPAHLHPLHHERHRPEQTTLYRLVQQHAASFIAHTETSTGAALPRFVKDEFDAFLECGILAYGFLRLRCGDCGHDKLLAFSCKRRGFCPSCGSRRMSQTAAHLVDHVIPHGPVRQWVLSLPIPLRVLLAAQPELGTPVLQVVVHRLIARHLMDAAELPAEEGQGSAVTLSADTNSPPDCLCPGSAYRIAFGPRAGQKVLTHRGAMPRETATRQPLRAGLHGFSLHAAVQVEAHDRRRLEPMCRCITRPALSHERVQLNTAGQVELKLKTPWRDGTTHLVLRRDADSPVDCVRQPKGPSSARARPARTGPLEFMQRLAALVPRPQRISWARLLKRVFDIDIQHCPNCGAAELKIIAAILERPVIEKILSRHGLDPQPPPRSRAREVGQAWAR